MLITFLIVVQVAPVIEITSKSKTLGVIKFSQQFYFYSAFPLKPRYFKTFKPRINGIKLSKNKLDNTMFWKAPVCLVRNEDHSLCCLQVLRNKYTIILWSRACALSAKHRKLKTDFSKMKPAWGVYTNKPNKNKQERQSNTNT